MDFAPQRHHHHLQKKTDVSPIKQSSPEIQPASNAFGLPNSTHSDGTTPLSCAPEFSNAKPTNLGNFCLFITLNH